MGILLLELNPKLLPSQKNHKKPTQTNKSKNHEKKRRNNQTNSQNQTVHKHEEGAGRPLRLVRVLPRVLRRLPSLLHPQPTTHPPRPQINKHQTKQRSTSKKKNNNSLGIDLAGGAGPGLRHLHLDTCGGGKQITAVRSGKRWSPGIGRRRGLTGGDRS